MTPRKPLGSTRATAREKRPALARRHGPTSLGSSPVAASAWGSVQNIDTWAHRSNTTPRAAKPRAPGNQASR